MTWEAIGEAQRVLAEWGQQRYGKPHPLGRQRRRLEMAGDRLRKLVDSQPDSHEARATLGRVLLHLGQFEGAERCMIAAIDKATAAGADPHAIGRYYFFLGRARMGKFERSQRALERVDRERFPKTAQMIDGMLAEQKKPVTAAFEQALAGVGEAASPAWLRDYAHAYVCWIKHDLDGARQKAAAVARDHPIGGEEGLLLLAEIERDPDARIALYDQVIDRARSFASGYRSAARARLARAKQLVMAWELDPEQAGEAGRSRILALFARAEAQAAQAVAIDRDCPRCQLALAEVRLAWGRFLARDMPPDRERAAQLMFLALDTLQLAELLAPADPDVQLAHGVAARELALVLARQGDLRVDTYLARAQSLLDRAISEGDESAEALEARARLHLARGQLYPDPVHCERAAADIRRAMEVEPMLKESLEPLLEACFARHGEE